MKIVELPLDSLEPRYAGLRARRPAAEKRLLASMGETGQQSPVIVVPGDKPGRYVLIEGRKRVRALRRLRADVVKATVWDMSPPEGLLAAYQMASGSGWNALEEGWLVYELVRKAGLSSAEVGRRLERSKAWVSGRLGLVEVLPERVQDGVRRGKIGAYAATKYLLPFARANAAGCEELAVKIMEKGLRSREVEALCRYWAGAGREAGERMLKDPSRFLRALAEAKKGALEPGLNEGENRCLRNFDLVGRVSLGLARDLPRVAGNELCGAIGKLKAAWARAEERFKLLAKTSAAVLREDHEESANVVVEIDDREGIHVEQGSTHGDPGAGRERLQPAADRQGCRDKPQYGQSGASKREGRAPGDGAGEPVGPLLGGYPRLP